MAFLKLVNSDELTEVDDDVASAVSYANWGLLVTKSGKRYVRNNRSFLHRIVMQARKGVEVDHIDGNTLHNKRANLRIATRSQNMTGISSKAGFVGVHRLRSVYRAYIRVDGKLILIGKYNSEREAAMAYNTKALELFGEFARLNEVQL